MSYNKKTFTNCFGEEMTRQIDEVEEKLGVEIDPTENYRLYGENF